jgi:antitoxin StbD
MGQTDAAYRHLFEHPAMLRDLLRLFKSAIKRAKMSTFDSAPWEAIVAHTVLAETTASISELKRNPMGTVAAGEGFPVAILNRNEPAFYCVPAAAYEALLDRLEDLTLNAIANARQDQAEIEVSLNEL